MRSIANLINLGTNLSQNNSGSNQLLFQSLITDGHRYNIQKYFDNERSFTTTTVGSATLTLTSAPNAGATSATLSAAWAYPTCTQQVNFTQTTQTATTTASLALNAVSATLTAPWAFLTATINTTFSNGNVRAVTYTNGSTAITWGQGLTATATTALVTVATADQRNVLFTNGSTAITWALALDSFATTTIGTVGVQDYAIPAIISKLTNDTLNVGQLKFVPAPIQTRDDWDKLNFLPYNSDIPGYYFIYQGKLSIFPVPSTTGNIITFNYKARVPDFSFIFQNVSSTWGAWSAGNQPSDYQQGTIATASLNGTTITGTSTAWSTFFPIGVDVSYFNLYLRIDPSTGGDGFWYPISQFNSATSLTLALPLNYAPTSINSAALTYSIGQMPLLQEDFHDMLAYYALRVYHNSIKKNAEAYKLYDSMYNDRLTLLEAYASTKAINVNLKAGSGGRNPNLYTYAQIGTMPLS